MAVPVIILTPAADAPADSTLLELTLRATDATPENVILYSRPSLAAAGLAIITLVAMGLSDSWPTMNQVTGGVEWYQDGVKYTGAAGAGSAVFPVEPDVRTGVAYGPSGADYTGSYNPVVLSTAEQIAVKDIWQRLGLDSVNPLNETLASATFGPVTLTKTGVDPETATRTGINVVGASNTMLAEIWQRLGLDPANPLSVGPTTITFGAITLTVSGTPGTNIVVTRT